MTPGNRRAGLGFLLALACAACLPACGRQKDGDIKRTGEQFLTYMVSEDFTAAVSLLEPHYAQTLPPDKLKQSWGAITRLTGQFRRERGVRMEVRPEGRVVAITCEFENRTMDLWLVFDQQGKIVNLRLVKEGGSPSSGEKKAAPSAPAAPREPAGQPLAGSGV
ncbi:MAG: DUF3887 domain-containing protein [Armatimonadota bacterium]